MAAHGEAWRQQKEETITIGTARLAVLVGQLSGSATVADRARVLALVEMVAGEVYGAVYALNAYGKLPRKVSRGREW